MIQLFGKNYLNIVNTIFYNALDVLIAYIRIYKNSLVILKNKK
jgi:hypothetical protein